MSKIITKNNIIYAGTAMILAILLFFIVYGEMGLIDFYELRGKKDLVVGQNKKLEMENLALKRLSDRLEKKDPQLIDRIARDELGMIEKNELIIINR